MADDSSLQETLANNLQAAIDKKLTVGEAVLMTLAGAHGEGLAATDRRVILVREQMPILGGETEIDCFDYPYDQISTVRVEDAIGGGHLRLLLITPPVDEKEVTLYFPPYALNTFDAAAARIRMLAEQTRSVPVGGTALTPVVNAPPSLCNVCGLPVDEGSWNYCAACGAGQGPVCGFCDTLLPPGAQFCPRCGTSAQHARGSDCAACGRPVSVVFAFCPQCGVAQGNRCSRCAGRILDEWRQCPACGQPTGQAAIGTRPLSAQSERQAPDGEPSTAEEHNAVGRRFYEGENLGEAVAHFQTAIELDPRNPLYHCNLGVVFAELGQDDAAIAEYESAVKLAPNDPTPYLNLGYFYSERENDVEARAALEKVIDVAPDSPEAEEARQIIENLGEV